MKILRKYWWFIILLLGGSLVLIKQVATVKIADEPLFGFNISEVSFVEIIFNADTVKLERRDSLWFNSKTDQPVDTVKLRMFFSLLNGLAVSSPVDKSIAAEMLSSHPDSLLKISVSNEGGKQSTFCFAKESCLNNRVVAWIQDSREVFVLNSSFLDKFSRTAQFADATYWPYNQLFTHRLGLVKSVELINNEEPTNSFNVNIFADSISVVTGNGLNRGKIERFINSMYSLKSNSVSTEQLKNYVQVVEIQKPYLVIKVVYNSRLTDSVQIFRFKMAGLTNDLGMPLDYDPNVFILEFQNKNLATGKYAENEWLFSDFTR